jgi:metallo-beta-lactamase family protein
MAVTLTFHGACTTVTGSCFELKVGEQSILIDCGMFQGTKTVKALNYGAFAFAPTQIAAVILTHAHVDHCGLIPKLTGSGFRGPVFATGGTADLLTYILPDSGYIQEIEVERLNIRNRQRGIPPVEPIYTRSGAEQALGFLKPKNYDTWFDVTPHIKARFWNAGHILGSTSVEIAAQDGKDTISILFSGDIGPGGKAFHDAPMAPAGLDYILMESTYGDRTRIRRNGEQRLNILEREIKSALKRGGLILMPAFAVERTQELLFDLDALFDAKRIPELPVFIDSPLATKATGVFSKHLAGKINSNNSHAFQRGNLRFVGLVEDSKKLSRLRSGAIIMAGSGMCDAGRIRHHLKAHLSRASTTVILSGYQAPGTLGRLLHNGEKTVRIQGEEVAVEARVRMLDEYSGHADQTELVNWLKKRMPLHQDLFLVHGEEPARAKLTALAVEAGVPRKRIHSPVIGETVRLTKTKGAKTIQVRATIDAKDAERDWHNDYAATVIALKKKLETLTDNKERERLMRDVTRTVRGRR